MKYFVLVPCQKRCVGVWVCVCVCVCVCVPVPFDVNRVGFLAKGPLSLTMDVVVVALIKVHIVLPLWALLYQFIILLIVIQLRWVRGSGILSAN